MEILPKDYLSFCDLSDYLYYYGYVYPTRGTAAFKLRKDIFDLIEQNKIKAVFRYTSAELVVSAYFVLNNPQAKAILIDDTNVSIANCSQIYRYTTGKLPEKETWINITDDICININDFYIPKLELNKLLNKDKDIKRQLSDAQANIARLEAKLKTFETSKECSNKPLYTTPAMNIMNAVIKEFWLEYDSSQPAPKQVTITRWITEKFEGTSDALALNIDKVCRHSDAKSGGKYKG